MELLLVVGIQHGKVVEELHQCVRAGMWECACVSVHALVVSHITSRGRVIRDYSPTLELKQCNSPDLKPQTQHEKTQGTNFFSQLSEFSKWVLQLFITLERHL